MHRMLARILIFFWVGAACAWAEGHPDSKTPASPGPEDMKVIAVMEILQLLDVAEEMEMFKELEYLIEDDQDER